MKKHYEKPFMAVSIFATENVVTTSSEVLTDSEAYKTTVDNITGVNKLVDNADKIFTFTF